MKNSPFSSTIKFPAQIDTFDWLYDTGTVEASVLPVAYTKVWGEHFNKLRNFIKIVQPLASPLTAQPDGSLTGLTYPLITPPVPISNILLGSAKAAYDAGKAPPSTNFPFEWVITCNTSISYDNWPSESGVPKTLFTTTQTVMNNLLTGGAPQVSISIMNMNNYATSTSPKNWIESEWVATGISPTTQYFVNHYISYDSKTILIRGLLSNLGNWTLGYDALPDQTDVLSYGSSVGMRASLIGVN